MPHKDPEVRKAYLKDWRKKNLDYVHEFDKNRWRSDPNRRAAPKRYHELNPNRRAESVRKSLYGMSPEEYNNRVAQQMGLCALCGRPETHIDYRTKKVQSLSVDHDHETGKNRELLCGDCNRGIGMFDENIELLLKAIEYLKKYKD